MPGARPPVGDSANANNVLTVFGQSRFENVNNLVQFDPGSTLFGSQANIYGTLQVQSANYEIDIYDTTNNLLRTITGHTTNGIIDEVWDLTTTNGQFREDDEFDAQIYITPGTAVAASGSVHPQAGSASSPYPLSFSRLGSCGDAFTMAFGWNTLCDLPFRKDMLRLGVLDIIFSPILDNTYANTSLNCYDCDPFFMYSTGSQTMLTNDLANGNAGNFFWYGHGSSYSFGAAETDSDINAGLSSVTAWDLGNALGNNWNRRHTRLIAHHPFRLVIMEGCDTAEDAQLSEAFGILGAIHSKQWFQRHGQPSQAYVGWTTEIFVPGCPVYDDPFMNHSEHQADMFGLWMSEVPLVQCVVAGATPYLNGFGVPVPFDTPLDANWRIFGDPNLTRTPSNEP
jgi:hypothetical protein